MKILVTGGTGLVGKAIQKISKNYPYVFLFLSSKDCDLTDYSSTYKLFNKEKPDIVIHLAACVGGLFKNMNDPVNMLEKNLLINLNVLKCSHEMNVKKVVSCLSTCIFPDKTSYPINEKMLHNGPPHNSNYAYAYAKRILEIQSRTYREQYNKNFICIIPTNIYGPYDNFSLKDAHVIPALIHRCYISKKYNNKFIVKGTGKPLRQFIYSEDLAELILWTVEKYTKQDNLILSVNTYDEKSIRYIAETIAKNFNYKHMIEFNSFFSDGQFKKTANNSKFKKLYGDYKFTSIEDGIEKTVKWFCNNMKTCRI